MPKRVGGRDRQPTPGRLSGRRARIVLLAVIAALVVVVLAVLVAALWPDDPAEPRAREYRDVTVCLLTGSAGVTDPAAAPVWAAMQESSLRTLARVQFLEVDGPQTADNAAGYLASLASSGCELILAVGEGPVAATVRDAARYPQASFVLVDDGSSAVDAGNVTVVTETDDAVLQQRIRELVDAAVGDPAED
ncbi:MULTISPECIES: hypothetical protein [unclassified Solwaraspora]|uniref:hypothetical protein n=1 Tax=unclassified Solwaraspora TaxID=2627926 RepID=UPI00259B7D3F|nr:hypothetical protein [Solwaraspora sp. WMMA2056]WJK43713.1 hypothetical protein O7608_15655 [Solwaraspora sp. WMMA2056]